MKIIAKTIAHAAQRYNTVGDWMAGQNAQGPTIEVTASDLNDWRYEALILIHEIVEAVLCMKSGVSGSEVDVFDNAYEAQRDDLLKNPADSVRRWRGGTITATSEPGDHPAAPYIRQHGFATAVERMLAAEMGIDWSEYESTVLAVDREKDDNDDGDEPDPSKYTKPDLNTFVSRANQFNETTHNGTGLTSE